MATQSIGALLDSSTFAGLSPAIHERLAGLGRLHYIPEGAKPIREGTPCDWLGVIVSGRIALRLRLPGGDDRTILTVEAGDVIGWSAVLPPAIATSTAIAVVPSIAIAFDGERLRAALATDCALAAAVYERLLDCVARRLVATRLQLLDLYRPGSEPW